MPELLKLLIERATNAYNENPSVALTGVQQQTGFRCSCGMFHVCVFLGLSAVYGMPTVMAAKSMLVLTKEEMCLYCAHDIFPRSDCIVVH